MFCDFFKQTYHDGFCFLSQLLYSDFFSSKFYCDEYCYLAHSIASDFSLQKIMLSAFQKKYLPNFFYRSLPSFHETCSKDEKTKQPCIQMGQQGN